MMFDSSQYPYNCFNYDGEGYPSCGTDEEKKVCRPAYRYFIIIIIIILLFCYITGYRIIYLHFYNYFIN